MVNQVVHFPREWMTQYKVVGLSSHVLIIRSGLQFLELLGSCSDLIVIAVMVGVVYAMSRVGLSLIPELEWNQGKLEWNWDMQVKGCLKEAQGNPHLEWNQNSQQEIVKRAGWQKRVRRKRWSKHKADHSDRETLPQGCGLTPRIDKDLL